MENKWDNRFMQLAEHISSWSSCCRHNVGAIIVKDNRVLATGYNGAPAGIETCKERGYCYKNKLGIESGPLQCYAVHAEQNAILQAAKFGISIKGATLYCTHKPCNICIKQIINSGIKRVYYKEDYKDDFADQIVDNMKNKIDVIKWE